MQLIRNVSNTLHLSDEEQRQVWANLKTKKPHFLNSFPLSMNNR